MVVDQNVEAAEARLGGVHHPMAVGEPFEVGSQCQHLAALPAQLVGQLVDQFGAIHRHQPAALFDETLGHAAADALGCAGDHGDFVMETLVHLPFPRGRSDAPCRSELAREAFRRGNPGIWQRAAPLFAGMARSYGACRG